MIVHPIPPVFDAHSEVLILGSFPSVKSRESGFFYGHPQNRFWKVTAAVFSEETPVTVEEKKAFLLRNHIAVWDVIGSCEIEGSSVATIRDVTVNDLDIILKKADIKAIYVNGKKAYEMYQRYTQPVIGREAICLPSTSPANAAWNIDRLIEAWRAIGDKNERRKRNHQKVLRRRSEEGMGPSEEALSARKIHHGPHDGPLYHLMTVSRKTKK